jgi:hypothetical protein
MTAMRPVDTQKAGGIPSTSADDQHAGEMLLPGTRAYADTARRFRSGEITAAQFLKLLYEGLAASMR